MLYAHYQTAEEIDYQLSYGQSGPPRDTMYANFAQGAYRSRAQFDHRLDQLYGPADRHRFDLFYTPHNPRHAPTVLFFHGGGWRLSDKFFANFYAEGYCPHGVNFIAATYGFLPQFTLPEIVEHARRCAQHVWEQADALGLDRRRLVLSGNSAGAHLAAHVWQTHWAERGLPEVPFQGAILFSGMYDVFANYYASGWRSYGWTPELVQACSPVFHVRPGLTPLLLFYGESETPEFIRQSQLLHTAATAHGIPSQLVGIPETDHFSSQWVMHQDTSPAHRLALDFIRQQCPA